MDSWHHTGSYQGTFTATRSAYYCQKGVLANMSDQFSRQPLASKEERCVTDIIKV
jgi:hypothetical protein